VNAAGSDWARLFRIACSLIRQVNSEHVIIDTWSFGGGTAMMLQIDHRRSDDIDIFLQDPQLLSYLDPKLHDFEFELVPSDYRGDGSHFLKLSFEGIGEIDFIVCPAMISTPSTRQTVEGEDVHLETLAEIITKKSTSVAHKSSGETSSTLLQARRRITRSRSAFVGVLAGLAISRIPVFRGKPACQPPKNRGQNTKHANVGVRGCRPPGL
jgi:hypothetical protein